MFNQVVAKRMGLDTRMNTSLWKDRAVVELTAAVIYSFQVFNSLSYIVIYIIIFLQMQKQNVTVVDHHTAAESFMTLVQYLFKIITNE